LEFKFWKRFFLFKKRNIQLFSISQASSSALRAFGPVEDTFFVLLSPKSISELSTFLVFIELFDDDDDDDAGGVLLEALDHSLHSLESSSPP